MYKKPCLRGPFKGQHGKQVEILLQSERQQLYHIYRSLRKQFSWKESLLEICKILRLFVNTLTADDKDSLLNRDNLTEQIRILLSGKQKAFSQFFSEFSKFRLNFEYFPKRDNRHSPCSSEITDSEKSGQTNVLEALLQRTNRSATWCTSRNTVAI